jgi:hypothetical protein
MELLYFVRKNKLFINIYIVYNNAPCAGCRCKGVYSTEIGIGEQVFINIYECLRIQR